MFSFEKLGVWQKSLTFADLVYCCSQGFPDSERFGLTQQIRRAAVSISANIAEGSARPRGDFLRFLGYAGGSVSEVVSHAAIARQQGFLGTADYDSVYVAAEELARMLSGLRRSLSERAS